MEMNFGALNWLAILTCVVVGQVFLTIWFVALFAKPWAKAYGVDDPPSPGLAPLSLEKITSVLLRNPCSFNDCNSLPT